jgi:hypothetical protein
MLELLWLFYGFGGLHVHSAPCLTSLRSSGSPRFSSLRSSGMTEAIIFVTAILTLACAILAGIYVVVRNAPPPDQWN